MPCPLWPTRQPLVPLSGCPQRALHRAEAGACLQQASSLQPPELHVLCGTKTRRGFGCGRPHGRWLCPTYPSLSSTSSMLALVMMASSHLNHWSLCCRIKLV